MRRVRIFKARGLKAITLLVTGRGLWCVECSTCLDITITFRTHDRAVSFVGAHLNGHAKAEALSARIGERLGRDLSAWQMPHVEALIRDYARVTDRKATDVIEAFAKALNTPINGGSNA